ncbi:MAG: transposase zinc-binding domain-containing protein, partial [Vicinamibacteria bacterium]
MAASPALYPRADAHPPFFRPRNPRATPLFQLVEAHYDDIKSLWEDRFEKAHGRWRGFTDTAVARYLDCASPECGFARLRCDTCRLERLLLFSCRQRGICPSCDAKRAAAFAAFLHDEVFEDVPHVMWVFTIPKMLRVYFLHHRELFGELSRCAYETIKELLSAAALEEKSFRPGMVSVVQTFGEAARFHPHVHALCSRGGWNALGEWVPVPYLDHRMAEELFRHHVLRLLKAQGLLSDERIALLLSWK